MNRTILIVICDFLLVSLLAFSTVDINKVAEQATAAAPPRMEIAPTNSGPDSGKDLAAVMRVALDEERRNRELLMGELARARDTVGRQENLLRDREQQVTQFQQQVNQVQQQVRQKEEEASRLAQQQGSLQQQYAAAQTNIQNLAERLRTTSVQAVVSSERLSAMEEELRKQREQAAALQGQLSSLQQSNQVVLSEKQRLSSQLQVAEIERQHATTQLAQAQQQVRAERAERAKLAEGVQALATKSEELTQEIRENRALAPNTIFFDVLTNKVRAYFTASRSGAFGIDATKRREAETVLVTDGTNTFALCHVQDTPLDLWNPGTDWEALSGIMAGRQNQVPVRSISFHRRDPRLVLVPLTPGEIARLEVKPYTVSADPFKFQDAILIGVKEGYYGECRFQIDVTTPDYVKLDNNFIKGLFGKFNPSRGDLVFSRNGELLGIMANKNYCLLLQNWNIAAAFNFASDVRSQHTGRTLAHLYSIVQEMPLKLQ